MPTPTVDTFRTQLAIDHPHVGTRMVVSLEPKARLTRDGIAILPVAEFLSRLAGGDVFKG